MKHERLSRGFTLIELLVVIAIISILAAILFPVFATAREKARATTCASNLKQLAIAFTGYIQDYDEVYPITAAGGNVFDPQWPAEVAPYLGTGKINVGANFQKAALVFACPDDPPVTSAQSGAGQQRMTYAMPAAHIGCNTAADFTGLVQYNVGGWPFYSPGRNMREILVAAQTLELVEQPNYNLFGLAPVTYALLPPSSNKCNMVAMQEYYATPLHSEGYNWLFCDGHVKWLRAEQTIGTGTATNPKGFWTLAEND